jgi:hypothetical protein
MHELRLAKYLDRMFDIVQCKHKKYLDLDESAVFLELEKVVQCQLAINYEHKSDP